MRKYVKDEKVLEDVRKAKSIQVKTEKVWQPEEVWESMQKMKKRIRKYVKSYEEWQIMPKAEKEVANVPKVEKLSLVSRKNTKLNVEK